MPDYSITISNTAQRQLDSLPDKTAEKLIAVIKRLAQNPRPFGYKKLKGRDGSTPDRKKVLRFKC